ncbi:5-carboxyvanillate decarboxylase [Sphingobium sp. SYK-6]|uniref:5-carboxyvanillate decarboxylase n=2 Tax=Sphingomonadaceae TaxID=41297 RepID=A0ACD6B9C4_SPHSK|nr:5-carboxyvanillate decarboxylase [Sphingobium sp. SYK-6]BAB85806.1 5-carboxyvanillate decarboxylase [Sphingomonas paucimobilis]BAB86295.1 5-carboxyvanillate decarboxylase [Sphingomonas paucimobilis]BAK65460.1 5-carboxyvanillate decarboxylase [Sphingobium sp. SYK-6]
MRLIATEEAVTFQPVVDALRAHSRTDDASLDMILVRDVYGDEPARPAMIGRLSDVTGERLAEMDSNGVDMHLLSLTAPGVQMFDAETGTRLARIANDLMAQTVAANPTRFAGLGTFAPQDPASAAREIERVATQLRLNGLVINSHTNDLYYDDPFFHPVFEAIEASGLALYIHPRAPSKQIDRAFRDYGMNSAIWGYGIETSTNAVRMILSGLFDRFPRLKIVLGHMGEAIPFWLWRLDYMHGNATTFGGAPKLKLKPSEYFRRNFAITTSGVESHAALRYSIEVLGPENVMWAIDYPYQPMAPAVQFIRTAPIPEDVKAMVAGGNAARIFRIT